MRCGKLRKLSRLARLACIILIIHLSPSPELVFIPVDVTLRPLLGSSLLVPCYFKLKTGGDPETLTMAALSHRIRWTYVSKNKATLILEALEGEVHVEKEYKDRVTMVNYPTSPTDATIEITEVRSKDSGTYHCEVIYDYEEIYDSVDIQVQGMTPVHLSCEISS